METPPKWTFNVTQERGCGELKHGEEDAPDDAALPAAGLPDGLGDELVLAEGLDADLPWGQTSFCLAAMLMATLVHDTNNYTGWICKKLVYLVSSLQILEQII